MRSWLFLAPLLFCASCRPPGQTRGSAQVSYTPKTDSDLQLSARILQTLHPALLALTLQNTGRRTLAVQTGIILGDSTPYPAAAFHFTLESADHSRSELYCGGCQPAAIFGSFSPFVVFLNPSERQAFTIQLPALYTLFQARRHPLGIGSDPGARIIVSLHGGRTEEASWLGLAEASVQVS